MAQRGPVITTIVVLGGLVGFMAVNASGGLVTSNEDTTQAAAEVSPTTTEPPVTTGPPTTEPPAATEPPTTTEPPAPAFPAEVVYAGNAADGAANGPLAIAVAIKGEDATAYLCDGAAVESWLHGTAANGAVELASADGSTSLTAALAGPDLAGTVSVGGQDIPFTVGVAAPPAGLYRGDDGATTVGWIILPDGTQVGIATTGEQSVPAPELDPDEGGATVGGRRVDADKVAGDSTFG